MTTTLTRYLKLKIDSGLSDDAKYNLNKIDSLGASGLPDNTGQVNIRSVTDILIEAESPDVGGSGNSTGTIQLGESDNLANILCYSTSFRIKSPLSLTNGNSTYLSISALSNVNSNYTLTLDTNGGNRNIVFPFSGNVVISDASQTITNKTISGSNNTITDIDPSSLSSPVPINKGGTNASSVISARINLLPTYSGNENKVLALNSSGTDLEWKVAGSGTLTGVTASSPLSVDNSIITIPNITLSQSSSSVSGYLSSTDWSTFNGKENGITPGTTSQYWRGDKSWQTLDKSAVGLSNVDNTSDANKPISSATQTALNAKEPTITAGTTLQYWRGDKSWQTLDTSSVPENVNQYFTDTRAKTAAVVNSTAGNETDQAPSVSSIKSYISSYGSGAISYSWLTSDGASKTITHNLNKATVSVSIYDETGEDIYVDVIDRTNTNEVVLTSSVAPTGTWTVVIRP